MKQPAQGSMGLVHKGRHDRVQVATLRDAKGASKQVLAERIMEAVRIRAEVQTTAWNPTLDIDAHAPVLGRHEAHEPRGLMPSSA